MGTTVRKKAAALAFAFALAMSLVPASMAFAADDGSSEGGSFFDNPIGTIANVLGFGDDAEADNGVETYAVGDEVENSAVADRDSTNDWNTVLTEDGQVSTQNIGRIWTDKSVFTDSYTFQGSIEDTITKAEGSDFLVGLSALSSTSNLKTVTTSTTPLDIVLVLDVSGSMEESMGSTMVYTETYNPSRNRTYYIQLENGEYQSVNYSYGGMGQDRGWYYGTRYNRTYVDYKRSANDDTLGRYQFYTRAEQQNGTKMEELQRAAGEFVNSVARLNDGIADENNQHRISLVKFASDSTNSVGNDTYHDTNYDDFYPNYSQVVSDLRAYNSQTADDLTGVINNLRPVGSTRADYGMYHASRVLSGDGSLTGAREGAKKVVIFFTDGEPGYYRFEDAIAGQAVNYAHEMKEQGATIYSIGVVPGADSSDTSSDLNRYLHATSSNYKDAECPVEHMSWLVVQSDYGRDTYDDGWMGNFSKVNMGGAHPCAHGKYRNSAALLCRSRRC